MSGFFGASGGGLTSPVGISDGGTGQTTAAAGLNALRAVGDVVFSPTAPASGTWLECKGQVLAQSSYASLYASVGLIGWGPWSRWTARTTANVTKTSILYGESTFVSASVSGTSTIQYSTDEGVTWNNPSGGPGVALYGLAYSSSLDLWVAVGTGGLIYATATPSGTWTEYSAGSTTFRDVCWDSSLALFVAVGDSGVIYTSANGTSWTSRTSGTAVALYGVATSGGTVVAVGASGTILSSTNGTSWTSRTSGVSVDLSGQASTAGGISYGGGYFVAGGTGGTLLYSANGTSWTQILPPQELRGVPLGELAYYGGRFIVASATSSVAYVGSFVGDGTDWDLCVFPTAVTTLGGIAVSATAAVIATSGTTVLVAATAPTYPYNSSTHFMLPDYPNLPDGIKAWIKAA